MFNDNKFMYLLIVCNNKLLLENPVTGESSLEIENVQMCPNTPFYQYLSEKNVQFKINGNFELDKKLFTKGKFLCICEDDFTSFDHRILEDFSAMKFHMSEITVINQYQLMNLEQGDLIILSKTNRCIVINFIKDFFPVKKLFLDKDSDIDTIKDEIYKVKVEKNLDSAIVYINNLNENMSYLSELGELINKDTIIKNSKYALEEIDKHKK